MSLSFKKYKCHKIVGALMIKNYIVDNSRSEIRLKFIDGQDSGLLGADFYNKHHKDIVTGAYLVEYEDGYLSISPAKVFNEGYSLLTDKPDVDLSAADSDMVLRSATDKAVAEPISAGDVVVLKSGSVPMTASELKDTRIECEWMRSDGSILTQMFKTVSLQKAP